MVLKTAFISTKLVRVATTASDNQGRGKSPAPLKLIRSQRAESCNYCSCCCSCCCSIVCQFSELEQLLETANSLLKVDDSCGFCFRKVISVH